MTRRVLAIDAGGTMTDTFIVDGAGSFVVGKAQTTPEDESVGFMESARDALEQWESTPEEAFGADRLRHLQRHGDAEPPALAPGPADRRDRHRRARRTTCGSSAGSRPTSASPTRIGCTSRPTTTTRRSFRASG